MKSARIVMAATTAALVSGLTACGSQQQAIGNVSGIVVVATDSLWNALGDSITSALGPRIFTVRDERTFEVTHVAPSSSTWPEMRRFRQVLAFGAAEDGWVRPILDARDAAGAGDIVQATDVWARNQFATAVVLPGSNAVDAAHERLPELAMVVDSAFRAYAVQRMYTSQPDTALRAQLRAEHGYAILLPNVYSEVRRDEEIALFQNSTQIGGDLVRSILITSRPGLLEPSTAAAIAWRDSVAATEYRPPQQTGRERVESVPLADGTGIEVQGIWSGDDPTWPTSGPFIAQMIQCPSRDRTFLIDAWLFAPSRAKYEYMIQLQTILSTFECVD
jgi:hypothetical protein